MWASGTICDRQGREASLFVIWTYANVDEWQGRNNWLYSELLELLLLLNDKKGTNKWIWLVVTRWGGATERILAGMVHNMKQTQRINKSSRPVMNQQSSATPSYYTRRTLHGGHLLTRTEKRHIEHVKSMNKNNADNQIEVHQKLSAAERRKHVAHCDLKATFDWLDSFNKHVYQSWEIITNGVIKPFNNKICYVLMVVIHYKH